MSFYGNIANGGKTNLTFDKVYANRYQMDNRAEKDGVFIGRFVFVEYDDNTFSYRNGYMDFLPVDTNRTYDEVFSDVDLKVPFSIGESDNEGYRIFIGDVVRVVYRSQTAFLYCYSKTENNIPLFKLLDIGSNESNIYDYLLNYNVDRINYGNKFSDGWDSTVWQKTVENGKAKYVMVGDLNSKVPRFYVKPEAPTLEPIPPHFDSNSTNMDYTLHVQPNWGFRIKKANVIEIEDEEQEEKILSDTEVNAPYYDYNKEEDTTTIKESYDGAIYFNKDGFKKLKRNFDNSTENEILLEPSGMSGNKYYSHNPEEIQSAKEDIQELTIHLPAIGNAVSDLWDMMYGDKEDDGSFTSYRNDNIDWESIPEPKREGVRLVEEDLNLGGFDYKTKKVETLAGCINSVHDLMGMIILDGDTSLADADTEHIYYGNLSGSSRKGYFMKTRKNTYTPLAHEDLKEYVGSKKYVDLTQYVKGQYHTKSNNNFYEELDEKPTPNTNYYDIKAEKIELKIWEPDEEPDIPTEEEPEVEYVNYWKDPNTSDYIKDINKKADPNKDYYTLEITQVTQPQVNEEYNTHRVEIYAPTPRVEKEEELEDGSTISYYEGYLYYEILGYEEDGVTPIYGQLVHELMAPIYDEDGQQQKDAEGNLLFEDAGPLREDAIYFYTKYKLKIGTDSIDKEVTKIPCDMGGIAFSADHMPPLLDEVTFLDFNEEGVEYYSYFSEFPAINDKGEEVFAPGYKKLNDLMHYDKEEPYYIINAKKETGYLEEEKPDIPEEENPETPEEEANPIFTHYYVPNKYYYKQGHDDYIFGTEEEMVPNVEYYILSGHTEDDIVQVTFYEPTKYYYEKEVTREIDGQIVKEIVQILDNDTTMKTKDTELGSNERILYNADNLVYFLKQEAYVVNDPSGILSPGSIWNSGAVIPTTLELGKLYQGEDVDINGNEVPVGTITNEEKAKRMYEWKELEGFARTLNTIHGLILKLNQYFKFDDTLTRDRTTVQGCLNCINDIINDFAALIPGEIAVIDEYGRIKSATLFTNAEDGSDEEGWISVIVDPDAEETKITIRHNDAKTAETILGQTISKTLTFGDTFEAVSFGIDDKGHVPADQFKEVTMTLPKLVIDDTDNKQIITDLVVREDGQAFVATRENVGNFALTDYAIANDAADIAATDTVNQAFGKLQAKLNKEIDDRIKAIDALDMVEDASTTQFISSISQTNGKLSVTRAAAGTLNLGSGYAIAETAANIDGNDSINSAFGKVEAKFKVLNGNSSEPGSIAYTIAEMAINADDNTSIDKLNEIAAWIVNDETGVAKMNADIAQNVKDIQALQITSGSNSADITNVNSRIDNLEALIDADKVANWNMQADWAEAVETSPAFIKNKPDLENLVKTTTEFSYIYNETTTQLTIDGLMAYIAKLEKRIYDLENPTESDPGTTE